MTNSSNTTSKNTAARAALAALAAQAAQAAQVAQAAQAAISFGAWLFAILVAVHFMDADPWVKDFLALGTLSLTTSTFTLARVVRDIQEDNTVVHRLDAARLDKVLAQHDPSTSA